MDKITITIHTTNDAFGTYPNLQVARILENLANRLQSGGSMPTKLIDYNGNVVGTVEVE